MNLMYETGVGPKINSKPVYRRNMHRREDNKQRRLLHPQARNQPRNQGGAERSELRDNPPHHMGILQPEVGSPGPVRGLEAAANEDQRRLRRVLGDQHRVGHRRVQVRRWGQHRAQRENSGDRLPVRRAVGEPQAGDTRELEDR